MPSRPESFVPAPHLGKLALLLSLTSSSSLASNTGFKLSYPLVGGTGTGNNWISLPYGYYPNGNVTQTAQNTLDICADLNGAPVPDISKVTQVVKWNTTTDAPQVTTCNGKTSFPFAPGEGISVKPNGPGIVIDIVGAHDDDYAVNKGGTRTVPLVYAGTNNNWFSVPYHAKATNTLELCATLNGAPPPDISKVTTVITWKTASDAPQVSSCAGKTAYPLVPGEGYSIKPAKAGISVSVEVY